MTLLIIDGNALVHPAQHSNKDNQHYRSDGLPVGAIGAFLQKVWTISGNVGKPYMATHGVVVFDVRAPNWRHDILPSYKSGRSADPEIPPQLRLCRAIVPHLGFKTAQVIGYEGDDLIATYVRLAGEAGMASIVCTSDKDALQLVRPGVSVFRTHTMQMAEVVDGKVLFGSEKDGVWLYPDLITHVQALAGDSTDGYSGIPGIGLKGAAELIGRFGDLETLLCRSDEISKPGLRAKVQAGALLARQSFRLASLDDQAPVPLDLGELARSPIDAPGLLSALRALEIVQFARRFAYPFGLRADDAEPCPRIADLADEQMEILAA